MSAVNDFIGRLDGVQGRVRYEPETGAFFWLSGRVVGERADRPDGSEGYRRVFLFGRKHAAHRVAWLLMMRQEPPEQIDHINGDRSDNRWSNLRAASHESNPQNRIVPHPANASSGLIGVTFDPSTRTAKPWRARITASGKVYRLGRFRSAEDANSAYLLAKAILHPFWSGADGR